MLLVGPWAIVSSHIRDALMRRNRDILFTLTEGQLFGSRNHRFSFNYTTDFEVMKAFFADKYAGGERVPHYSLLVDESYELVVIRIGRAAKNSIVPERLQELVEYRVDRNKPTWVVTDRPWAQGHPVWSPELAETLETFGVFEPEPEPEGGEEVA